MLNLTVDCCGSCLRRVRGLHLISLVTNFRRAVMRVQSFWPLVAVSLLPANSRAPNTWRKMPCKVLATRPDESCGLVSFLRNLVQPLSLPWVFWWGGVLVLLAISPLRADDRVAAQQWLEKMSAAQAYLNYEGSFIYINGPKVETMTIVHAFDQHGERERISTVTGQDKEWVRDDKHQFYVIPQNKLVLVNRRGGSLANLARSFAVDSPNYDYYLEGEEQVADFACQVVSIVPHDAFRYGYRLCLEKETGLLLKSQVLDKAGQPKEQLVFTRLTLPEKVATASLQATMRGKDFTILEPGDREARRFNLSNGWFIDALPQGFRVVSVQNRNLPGVVQPVEHVVVDDGIATISIFIVQDDPSLFSKMPENRIVASGALHLLALSHDRWRVVVMGAVPVATIEKLAGAIHQESADS